MRYSTHDMPHLCYAQKSHDPMYGHMVPFMLHSMDLEAIISDAKRRRKTLCNHIATFAAANTTTLHSNFNFLFKHHACHDELPLINYQARNLGLLWQKRIWYWISQEIKGLYKK